MVSVVIPAYNAEQTLAQCLSAFNKQTFPSDSFEIIVVDDGSTDRTAEIAQQFSILYLHQENQGPATARNHGATSSNGEILLFTDSDCIPTPHWIEEMVKPFQQKDVMAVKGAYCTAQKEIVARFAQIEFEERFTLLEKAGTTDMVDTYSAGYRRHIFQELNGFDTRFPVANNEDTEFSYRMAALQLTMVFTPKAIVRHLNHPDSVIKYGRLKFSRGYWRMAVYRQFPKKMFQDTYTPKSLKIQIIALFLILVALPSPFFLPNWGWIFILTTICFFIASIVPFVLFSIRKDTVVALYTPFLLAVRAVSLGSGALWGSIHARLQ